KIRGGNPPGCFWNWEINFCLERAIAVANKDADVLFTRIGDSQIQFVVVIVIGHGDIVWGRSSLIKQSRLKSPVAIPKKNRDVITCGAVGNREVKVSITIKISRSNEFREIPGRIIYSCLESSVAIAQQNAHVVIIYVSHCEVEIAILIEITQ